MLKRIVKWSGVVLAMAVLLSACVAGETPPETTAGTTTTPAATQTPNTEPPATAPEPTQDETKILVEKIYRSVQEMEEKGRVSFAADGSPEEVLEVYAETAYPAFLDALPEGNLLRPSEYIPVSQRVLDTMDDAIRVEFAFAVPEDEWWFHANGKIDQEGFEGYRIIPQTVALELHDDGLWYEASAEDFYVVKYKSSPGGSFTFQEDSPEAVAGREYLARIAEEFAQAQAQENDEARIKALAEVFMKCVIAAADSQSIDFDWTQICTQEATELLGLRSMIQQYIKSFRGPECNRDDWEEAEYDAVAVHGDTALVKLSTTQQVYLYFVKIDDTWWISDLCRPYAR
ncbi:MAG TPA: hypothetical protein IAC31_06150 [Candidatus Faecousia intestinigallinarum]|nr:hypothetical protein [Candidatus Faecousia intestinigallinarum]